MKFEGIISFLFACIELLYAINLLIFAKKNTLNKLLIGLIVLLFGYQSLETLICFAGLQQNIFVYLAFLDISFLPPLSLYAILLFTDKLKNYHKYVFLPALFFVIFYLFVVDQFVVAKCTVLYASYNYPLGDLYGAFYYLPIVLTILLLFQKWRLETEVKQKQMTGYLFFGYLFTFAPGILLVLFVPGFIQGVESYLCKLAFILATFSTLFVLKNKS